MLLLVTPNVRRLFLSARYAHQLLHVVSVISDIYPTPTSPIVWPVITPTVKHVQPKESVLPVWMDTLSTTKLIVSLAINLTVQLATLIIHAKFVKLASAWQFQME